MKPTIPSEERAAILALNTIFGFSPSKGRALLTHLEDAREVFYMDRTELMRIGIKEERYLSQLTPARLATAVRDLASLEDYHGHFITLKDESYPSLLTECKDAPVGLYLKSQDRPENIFSTRRPYIAIVGTRDISPYGTEVCIQLVRALSQMRPRPLIVSGLALGVDITAHKAAMENQLPTVAVMATGIDSIYPYSHGWAAEQISKTEGSGLISDYPLHTTPQAVNFIRRNRIMAGMCMATILIESKSRGGGLITAKLASSYNREVYAVPGRITDSRSQGCNHLISKNIASALTDYGQIASDLGFTLGCQQAARRPDLGSVVQDHYLGQLPDNEVRNLVSLVNKIQLETEIPMGELANLFELPYPTLLYYTGLLETDGFISIDLLHNCSINKEFV